MTGQCTIKPKTRRRLAVLSYVVAIGTVCMSLYMGVIAYKFFSDKGDDPLVWDDPLVRKSVIKMICSTVIAFIGGFAWWRMGLGLWRSAHTEKQETADAAKPKAE